ncbi:MAG: imidazole glycerol phosphate synthase subunit HisH [Tannerellaceae bacterium]|jgi:glutamine amidotransferase|nr:imidazole glycerol phosphate synthase subunit HisH [Tannerellaceae bacterium]
MKIAIIKYNAGNICSVDYALRRFGIEPVITSDPEEIGGADKVIFPGVGHAGATMLHLRQLGLDRTILSLRQPVLGICLGMQLLCRHSSEGDVDCLGVFDVEVDRFIPQSHADKVPHIGWNVLKDVKTKLFDAEIEGRHVYFVHSYFVPLNPHTAATTSHIHPFSAALSKDNFYATQFHPEKSGDTGERILKNFLHL